MSIKKNDKKSVNKIIKVKVTRAKSSTAKIQTTPTMPVKVIAPIAAQSITTKIPFKNKSHICFWQHTVWFVGLLVVILLVSTVIVATQLSINLKPEAGLLVNNILPDNKPNTLVSILTGESVTSEVAERRPLAVVVENYPTSRPQAGLSFADLVWEAPTEGGITRFLAIFQKGLPSKIGPVRSARPYFNDWVREVAGFYAHSGGSPEALAELTKGIAGVQDVNEFSHGAAYWREENEARPHNLYTATSRFYSYAALQNWSLKNTLSGWLYGSDKEVGNILTEQAVQILVPYYPWEYDVLWKYQAETGVYLRSMDYKPHIDKITNQQLQTKNLIVMFTDVTPIPHDPLLRVNIRTIGEGQAYLFTSGKVYQGKWQRTSLNSSTEFLASDGSYLPLTPGNIWISVMDNSQIKELEYK